MQKLIDELKLYPGKDLIPTELAEKVLPVFQINSDEITVSAETANIVRNAAATANGNSTVYTTPATGSFYLTNLEISACGYATDELFFTVVLTATIDGSSRTLATVHVCNPASTTGADNACVALNFQNPILIDQGTNIVMTLAGDDATSWVKGTSSIMGYTQS